MLRDEAHRSSNRGREIRGSSRRFHSALDDIRGLGPVARTALRKHLGTVEGIRKATDEEILAVPGINRRHLRALRAAIPAPELGTELTSESAESRDAGETEVLPEVSSSTKIE
jgi:excinuclease ABC subunit C